MRHVPQELVLFLRQLQQAHAQPFELLPEALEVGRARDLDRSCESALAELTDRRVELPNRLGDQHDEEADEYQRAGHERRDLPCGDLLRFAGIVLQVLELGVDVGG